MIYWLLIQAFDYSNWAASAALSVPNDLGALLPGSDAVFVALRDFLADPLDEGRVVRRSLELRFELRFELLHVRHGSEIVG